MNSFLIDVAELAVNVKAQMVDGVFVTTDPSLHADVIPAKVRMVLIKDYGIFVRFTKGGSVTFLDSKLICMIRIQD